MNLTLELPVKPATVGLYRELLLGCGNSRDKRLRPQGHDDWTQLTTLDIDSETDPDVVHDLEVLPLLFDSDSFNEVHAYEVLEHTGRQGDWKFFFRQWSEFYRILRPNGLFLGSTPMWSGLWAWGDPGHSRVISRGSLTFLDQNNYSQVGTTAMTDYRSLANYCSDFELVEFKESLETFMFVLRARK